MHHCRVFLVIVDRMQPHSVGVENAGNQKVAATTARGLTSPPPLLLTEEDLVFAERCSYSRSLFRRPDLRAIPPRHDSRKARFADHSAFSKSYEEKKNEILNSQTRGEDARKMPWIVLRRAAA